MYKEYIKVFKSAISEKTCNEIVAELQNCNWTKNEVYVDANGVTPNFRVGSVLRSSSGH